MKANWLTSWKENQMKRKRILKSVDRSTWPKVYPAPRGEMPQPQRSSGSDHNRSHMGPSCGTSWTRSKFLMLSRVSIDGDNPPCRQKISDSTYSQDLDTESVAYLYTSKFWIFKRKLVSVYSIIIFVTRPHFYITYNLETDLMNVNIHPSHDWTRNGKNDFTRNLD